MIRRANSGIGVLVGSFLLLTCATGLAHANSRESRVASQFQAGNEPVDDASYRVVKSTLGCLEEREQRNADGTLSAKWTVWKPANEPAVKHGVYESYGTAGRREKQGQYYFGRVDGVWRSWDEDGVLTSVITFVEGKLIGGRYTRLSGGTSTLSLMLDDQRSGPSVEWDSATGIIETVSFHDEDKQHGSHCEFVPGEPMLLESGMFRNGLKNGRWRAWETGGRLTQLQEWVAGKLEGTSQKWHISGALAEVSHYRSGKRNGSYLVWHENGTLRTSGSFRDDRKVGTWRAWNELGSLTSEVFEGE